MKTNNKKLRNYALSAFMALTSFAVCQRAMAQFPPIGDDLEPSIGSYVLAVNPAYTNLLSGYPGWNPTAQVLSSPLLFDAGTVIGRSDVLTNGSVADRTGGVQVGTTNGMNLFGQALPPVFVADQELTYPSLAVAPPGWPGDTGTREVHLSILWMDLTNSSGASVLAGYAASQAGFNIPFSPGQVLSLNTNDAFPANDFPAISFFDVFVVATIPAGGSFPGATVTNAVPLIIACTNIIDLPPKVIYTHVSSTSVDVYFTSNDTSGNHYWVAGQKFASIILAGHGITYQGTNDQHNYMTNIASQPYIPLNPTDPGWSVSDPNAPIMPEIHGNNGYRPPAHKN